MTKGFWISIELLHDKKITMQEKLLLIEINQLSMLDKGCIASNNHFANTFLVKKESISRSLSSLENKGYITTQIRKGSRNHDRTITINKMLFDYKQNVIAPITKCLETKENKTENKTKNDFDLFIEYVKANATTKSKVTITKETKKLYKAIADKNKLALDYLQHQADKKEFAQRLTPYLLDYNPIADSREKTEIELLEERIANAN